MSKKIIIETNPVKEIKKLSRSIKLKNEVVIDNTKKKKRYNKVSSEILSEEEYLTKINKFLTGLIPNIKGILLFSPIALMNTAPSSCPLKSMAYKKTPQLVTAGGII